MPLKYILIPLLSTCLLSEETFNIEDDFLKSLNEISQVATKTKLNRDQTTSFVSVLQGKKLQKLGVNDVYEALRYIPGIELSKEASGVRSVIFRGSVTKGEVKFMIDGVEINNAYRASFYYFLDLPIELISRIEVLRGPGSVLYGSGAINGVINIITKSSQNSHTENELFLSGGSYGYAKGGTRLNVRKENYQIALDAYYQRDDKEIDNTDQRLNDFSVGVNIKAYDLELNARIKRSIQGNSYGVFDKKDQSKEKYDNQNKALFANLKYQKNIFKKTELKIALNYNQYAQIVDDKHPSLGDIKSDFKEKSYNAKIELLNNSIQNNQLLVGVKAKHAQVEKANLSGLSKPNIVTPNLQRDIYSVYLNNNYLISAKTNLDIGLRYDDYSDFGDNLSPDIGVVYRATNNLSFKAKYAHAFRAPSWTELSGLKGNDTLQAEVSENTEIGMIYQHSFNLRSSFNAYVITIDDYIQKTDANYFQINSELNLKGAELDLSYTPFYKMELNFAASYLDAQDAHEEKIPFVANFLSTNSLIYTSDYGVVFGSTFKYANSRDMTNEVIFDQSISYRYKDLNVDLLVNNLFNSDIIYYDSLHGKNNPIKDAARMIYLKTTWQF